MEADFLDDPLPDGAYDFVSAVAVVHHVDFSKALSAMARLLAPGGRLVVVGLAGNRTPLDWIISGAGLPAARFLAWRHTAARAVPPCRSSRPTCRGRRYGRRRGPCCPAPASAVTCCGATP
ncbi:methyltransferase domain-containing protein [Nonomuraea dietziae]|uniref:methyltransferase domain-containing protein n=1 Tax=Nonomuraea dietziae TaxID=65515 RepID=UPI0031D637CB